MSSLTDCYDLLVVGGGVNGCGIARDATGRGLKVMLVEREDLAIATSSASTKLIHGGLRYLEYYEFRLVREALQERERLVKLAPHIIWPLRLIVPLDPTMRPAWMIRMGLFLYDHLGGKNSLPKSRLVRLLGARLGAPLKDIYKRGFAYSDAWVDDARMVMLNAKDAVAKGARVETRCALLSARRDGDLWHARLRHDDGREEEVMARAVVNAAGPWVQQTLTGALGQNSQANVRLVKGSHIIIPRLYEGDHAFFFQNPDKRVIFTIPYEGRFTLIGTTDIPVGPDERKPNISPEEVDYLCAAVSRYFKRAVMPSDIVWTYSGVRPLYDDGADDPSAVTRDYVLDLNEAGPAPLLSVYGGKITTYRRLAEHAMETLGKFFPRMGRPWTGQAILPGGAIGAFDDFFAGLVRDYPAFDGEWLRAFAHRHGDNARKILGQAKSFGDLGRDFGGGLSEAEANWCRTEEWAKRADDILWRRTKCGLHMTAAQRQIFTDWFGG